MIAFLGTGLLGSSFVRALLARGESVNVWNRSPEKARALEQFGATAFDDPADAVRNADRVHIALSDDAAVDAVLERAAPSVRTGVVIIDHTTVSPDGTRERVRRWNERGVHLLHAPVFMGPPNALNSTGVMMASGERARFDAVKADLEKMTGQLIHLGEDPSRAAAMKLLGNHLIVSFATGLSDTLSLCQAMNLPQDEITHLLEFFNPGTQLPVRLARIRARDFDNPTWTLDMARKDVRLMMDAAGKADVELIALPAIAEAMDARQQDGDGSRDWTIVTDRATS